MKRRLCGLGILLVALVVLAGCDLLNNPCSSVYFDGEMVMVPDCLGSREVNNMKYDANGRLISYNFSVQCNDGPDYSGSVTLTRDAAGNVTGKKLVVNGKTCEE